MKTLIATPIKTADDARAWIKVLADAGMAWSPDEAADDCLRHLKLAPTTYKILDEQMDRAHALLPDVYETITEALGE